MNEKKVFRYQAIYQDLRTLIADGTYQERALLPPEKNIAEQYSVDRSTVRKALQLLVEEGLVVKAPGIGTIVSKSAGAGKPQLPPEPAQSASFSSTVHGTAAQSSGDALRTNHRIAFLLSRGNAITELFYSTLFYRLETEFQRLGCSLIYSTLDAEDDLTACVRSLAADGIIFVSNVSGQHIQDSISLGIPCVLINAYHPEVPSILSDNERGAYLICRYLIEQGHREIVALSGVRSYITNQERLSGYRRALKEAGIPVRQDMILDAESWDLDAGTEVLLKYLGSTDRRPTAVFGLNDRLAGGAMLAAHQAGLRVPEDLSVAGYDNLDNMRLSFIRMTTVEAHIELMAEAAADQLLWQISGGSRMPLRITTPVDLVLGETVKKLAP